MDGSYKLNRLAINLELLPGETSESFIKRMIHEQAKDYGVINPDYIEIKNPSIDEFGDMVLSIGYKGFRDIISELATIKYFQIDIANFIGSPKITLPLNLKEVNLTNVLDAFSNKFRLKLNEDQVSLDIFSQKDLEVSPYFCKNYSYKDDEGIHLILRHKNDVDKVKIHHSLDKYHVEGPNLPWFTVYPDMDNPWGDLNSKSLADETGVTLEYYRNEYATWGEWKLTILKDGGASTFIEISGEDIIFKPRLIKEDLELNTTTPYKDKEDIIEDVDILGDTILKLSIVDDLLFTGELFLRCVGNVTLGDVTISKYLATERFFKEFDGELQTRAEFIPHLNRLVTTYSADEINEITIEDIMRTLKVLTGDEWVISDENTNFNLKGAKILYNGLASNKYPAVISSHPYVLAIELSDSYCKNLFGNIRIGYQRTQPYYKKSTYSGIHQQFYPIFSEDSK